MAKSAEGVGQAATSDASNFKEDFENLKASFAQLRTDVTNLLNSALGAGKSGVGTAKEDAAHVANDLKEQCQATLDALENKIEERPVACALIAFAVGFVIARIFSRR